MNDLLERLNVSVPRYTSYPTANTWKALDPLLFLSSLRSRDSSTPLSLYIHIPFCHALCLYCGCAVVVNRRPEREEEYVEALLKEIDHAHSLLPPTHLQSIHFGGGSPTKLSDCQLGRIIKNIREKFTLSTGAEIVIEVDPRTATLEKFKALKDFGFNRISLGIQDLNKNVQEVVGRCQSEEVSRHAFELARSLHFESINIDLIYGLPQQTQSSFAETIDKIIHLRPDRVSLFSFAFLPHLLPHQKTLSPPPAREKFLMYAQARRRFLQHGFVSIGMDHFASPTDILAEHSLRGLLRRNFQGYTTFSSDILGLGMTAISTLSQGFFQHPKTLASYYDGIKTHGIPCDRGIVMSHDDKIRQWVIEKLMCHFSVDKKSFLEEWGVKFDDYFHDDLSKISPLIEDGLVEVSHESIAASKKGVFFIRSLASCFDAYLQPCYGGSKAI
jgi:oxygen-independent coproporphyrinogen-3 oxidase